MVISRYMTRRNAERFVIKYFKYLNNMLRIPRATGNTVSSLLKDGLKGFGVKVELFPSAR
jgi:hypothetical protein